MLSTDIQRRGFRSSRLHKEVQSKMLRNFFAALGIKTKQARFPLYFAVCSACFYEVYYAVRATLFEELEIAQKFSRFRMCEGGK